MSLFRSAYRILSRSPLLTLVVVLSLGLGIGANTAIFSVLYQAILRSLPVQDPSRLVFLRSTPGAKSGRQSSNNAGNVEAIFSYPMFRELEKRQQALAGIAAFRTASANLAYRKETLEGSLMLVSGGYFPVLGVRPYLGRLIGPEDDVHGAGNPVVVLSYGFWKGRLGGQFDVLNQPLRVNGKVFTIVGLAPELFHGTALGDEAHAWVPLSFKPLMTPGWDGTDNARDYWLYVFARLQPGLTMLQAQAAMDVVFRAIVREQERSLKSGSADERRRFLTAQLTMVDGRHGQSSIRDEARTPLAILMVSTVLVLLIAIANTANLLLARAAQRKRELAIRTALGAGRGVLMTQMLTEAMVLSIAGGLAGILIAAWSLDLLIAGLAGENSGGQLAARLEWPVLLFSLGLSLLSGLLCGLYPAWDAARGAAAAALKDQSGQSSSSLGAARVRKILVCAQVTVSVILLVPTGLFLKSLANLTHVDLGLRTDHLLTFRISPELSGYKPAQSRALFERAEQQLAQLPGVTSVTTSMVPLISGSNWGSGLTVEGYSREPGADRHSNFNVIGLHYFGQLGIPLLNGREFTERDTLGNPKVAIVNEQFARHFFGGENPIGRKFVVAQGNVTPDTEIVGLVKDSHYSSVKQVPPRLYFLPWRQDEGIGMLSFYVRTAGDPDAVSPLIRRAMASLDADLPLEEFRTLDDQVRTNIRSDRMVLQLSGVFAALATLLAMLGLYGVMAYSVTRRTREIGIRIALGAPRESIRAMVLRELLLILGGGLAAGLPAAIALARLTESQLFGVKSFDVMVVLGAIATLTLASLLAGYLPARRATRINPTIALRYE